MGCEGCFNRRRRFGVWDFVNAWPTIRLSLTIRSATAGTHIWYAISLVRATGSRSDGSDPRIESESGSGPHGDGFHRQVQSMRMVVAFSSRQWVPSTGPVNENGGGFFLTAKGSIDRSSKWEWWWLFPRLWDFGRNVRPFIPCQCFFCKVELSSRTLVHSLGQDQSTLAQRAETTVAECSLTSSCELDSEKIPTLCLDIGIVSPLRSCLVKGVCVVICNLPLALLVEWPGAFTYHCGNTGVERTPNKSQHTKLTLEKKILPPLLPVFELATFRSLVRRFTNKLSWPKWLSFDERSTESACVWGWTEMF